MAPIKVSTGYRSDRLLSSRTRFIGPPAGGKGVPDAVRRFMSARRQCRIELCAKIHAHVETHCKPAAFLLQPACPSAASRNPRQIS
jgi:hypothetical protein